MAKNRKVARKRIQYRIRKRISGNPERPRVAVFRSLKHIYLQAIDDISGTTIAFVSSNQPALKKKLKKGGDSAAAAEVVGSFMAEELKKKGCETVIFDRGGFIYHGRVRAAAEAMRKGGIKF